MTYKTLLVISKFPPEYSGPGVRIPRLYKWLNEQEKKYEFMILCNGLEITKNEIYDYKGFPVRRVVAEWLQKLVNYIPFFPKFIKDKLVYQLEFFKTLFLLLCHRSYKNVDLYHIAGYSGGTAATLITAKIKAKPVLMELVTAEAPVRQKMLFLFKTPLLKKLRIIALTHNMVKKTLNFGVSSDLIWCRPNPIDEERFSMASQNEKRDLRKALSSFDEDKIILVSVAKIMPQKNQLLILKILPYLPEKFVALIAGPIIKEGPLFERDQAYLKNIEDFIVENNLQKRVQLVTDFVHAENYIKASDIYMMPAWNEGFGTPMIEAFACGLPVIANKNEPAFQEWINEGENGYLCDIHNPKEWAKAVKEVTLLSRNQCQKMSQDIQYKAGQSMIYAKYKDIIDQLIETN